MPIRIEHVAEAPSVQGGDKKLFIKSYGCQMNVYDAQRMAEMLAPEGYTLSDSPEAADLVILNTCHIRENAEAKVFSDLGRYRVQAKPDAVLAVGGCVGQAEGAQVFKRASVNLVFGPQTYHRLPDMIRRAKVDPRARILDVDLPELEKFDHLPTPGVYGPSAFLTIQEGCDKFCSFCVVPYTRGAEISRPLAQVLAEAEKLAAKGVKELTLLGQNVNAYHGADGSREVGLGELLRRLATIDGLERLRFTTSHPNNMDDELLQAFADEPKVMPYMHLPVQAGSDRVLAAMNRNHTAADYLATVAALRQARPDVALSGDFIVGFPGETDDDFARTLDVVDQARYAQAYSFMYSPRPGTPGAAMPNPVDDTVKSKRLAALQALLDRQQAAFNAPFAGQTVPVLIEGYGRDHTQLRGRSPHNVVVNIDHGFATGPDSPVPLIGQTIRVNIHEANPRCLIGTLPMGA